VETLEKGCAKPVIRAASGSISSTTQQAAPRPPRSRDSGEEGSEASRQPRATALRVNAGGALCAKLGEGLVKAAYVDRWSTRPIGVPAPKKASGMTQDRRASWRYRQQSSPYSGPDGAVAVGAEASVLGSELHRKRSGGRVDGGNGRGGQVDRTGATRAALAKRARSCRHNGTHAGARGAVLRPLEKVAPAGE
jgi:hypothetical protein